MQATANLALPCLMPAQAQKHVTHNDALEILDAVVHLSAAGRTGPAVPPTAAIEGERHVVPPGAGGEWSGEAGRIACFSGGGWMFLTPRAGWTLFVEDEARLLVHDGTGFADVVPALPDEVERWGVGTAPGATNRFAVSSPATLLNHAGTDHRVAVNKASAADTASLVFQSGFSGRAEIGLAGTNAFSMKVSTDGSTWREALRTDPATGALAAPNGLAFAGPSVMRHYEEGAYTPSLRGGTTAGSPTYTVAEGTYVRIGSLVTAWGRLSWTAKGGIDGALSIHGLPFPNRPGLLHRSSMHVSWYSRFTMGSSVTMLGGFLEPGATHIRLWGATTPGTGINRLLLQDAIGEQGEVYFSVSYLTS